MNNHVIHFVDDSFFVDSGRAGTARQHAGTAAGRERNAGIELANFAADPQQVIGETVLIEACPVVPKRRDSSRAAAANS